MIVSGFTQKMIINTNGRAQDTIIPGQHNHCNRCHIVNCSKFVDNVNACGLVVCELCGWRCHECKLSEHSLTCPEERVTCLNKEYGCPHILKRSKIASHLSVCPASVVFCAEEWNRWPMHAREQGLRMPLPPEKNCLECGQLDVGLAMRDQRMLIDSLHAPRKLRHTLRNSLTQKYPAAPFPSWRTSFDSDPAVSDDTSLTVSDDDADAPWDLSKSHPGLKESIRSRLFRVSKETADSLVTALEMTNDSLSSQHSQILDTPDANHRSILNLKGWTKTSVNDSLQTNSFLKQVSPVEFSELSGKSLPSPLHEYLSKSSANTTVDMNIIGATADGSLKQPDIIDEHNIFVDDLARRSMSSDTCSDSSNRSKSTLHDIGGKQLHKLMGYNPTEGKEDGICLHKLLGVSINIECINKYVIKPQSMYTFICAQNFRRDEYPWHFKNVHLEIHTGFSGWLEQRCPLANLGCTYSINRMEPGQANSVIYHSWLQESFGLRSTIWPDNVPCKNNADSIPKSALSVSLNSVTQCNSDEFNQTIQGSTVQQDDQVLCEHSVIAQPSISNLAKLDIKFEISSSDQPETETKLVDVCNLNSVNKDISLGNHRSDQPQGDASSTDYFIETGTPMSTNSKSHSQSKRCQSKTENFMSVQPTIFTASNWDSKVLFQYDIEEEDIDELEVTDMYHLLTNLPFEVLRHIARHLDSFSLCNLALTCHLLRDVCCSLLDDRGIVLLNWQKHKSQTNGQVTWKVVSKRWMFSTSFEPIRSWRFVNNRSTIGDHLKVCPFNKDLVHHSKSMKMLID